MSHKNCLMDVLYVVITGGGEIKVVHQKLEWKVTSKIGSLENVKHRPGGGKIQIFDEKYASRGSSRSSSTVRASGNGNPSSAASEPTNKPETRDKDFNGKYNIVEDNPRPLPMKQPPSTSISQQNNSNLRSSSATRRSPPDSNIRKKIVQQNITANKINDSNTSSAPPISASSTASSSVTDQPVAANHGQQSENPNSNPKPPIAAKPSHNLKWWKNKK